MRGFGGLVTFLVRGADAQQTAAVVDAVGSHTLANACAQTRYGGTGVRSIHPYHLEEYPWRMEFGTPNMVGIAALWAGQDWIAAECLESVHDREMKLAQRLGTGLREIEGVSLYCCESMRNHLSTVSINVEGLEAADVGMMLDVDHNIATRTGLHCAPLVHEQIGTLEKKGMVRFSVGAFNTEAHIEAALGAVKSIAEWKAARKAQLAVRD